MTASFTNSSLAVARSCLRKFQLQFDYQLELAIGEPSEALQVGSTWHKAHHYHATGRDPYQAIHRHAPSPLWIVKLSRLFAAYHWYWKSQPLRIASSEWRFRMKINQNMPEFMVQDSEESEPFEIEGQVDGSFYLDESGAQVGIVERKTTSEDLGAESSYWNRLRLDTQCGIYALAGQRPAAILYDVVRKPTINPKAITKTDVERFRKELGESGSASYFGERFTRDVIEQAIVQKEEGLHLYGARLTADIGDRPEFYFARREVVRTSQDYDELIRQVSAQIRVIEFARTYGYMHRNPNACNEFGLCQFFKLCANNIPVPHGYVPEGYRVREHLHPELAFDD